MKNIWTNWCVLYVYLGGESMKGWCGDDDLADLEEAKPELERIYF